MKGKLFPAVGIMALSTLTFFRTRSFSNYHPQPDPISYTAYMPLNHELLAYEQVQLSIKLLNGDVVAIGQVLVRRDQFAKLVSQPGARKPMVTYRQLNSPNRLRLDYWLSRDDGLFYHTFYETPEVSWGGIDPYFDQQWRYEGGNRWVVTAVWNPSLAYVIMWLAVVVLFGGLCFLVSAWYDYSVDRRIRASIA